MTKLSTLFLLLFTISIQAQPVGYGTISPNGMEVGMHSDGTFFMDESKINGNFKVDESENLKTIFSSSLWVSCVNPSDQISASKFTFGGASGELTYIPGPFGFSNFNFDQVWVVKGSDIIALINDFSDGSVDNTPDESIMNWPGKGNPLFPELPDQDLAPFYDQNNDGIYNPMEGDYPIVGNDIGNMIPIEMMYAVYNDGFATSSVPAGVEFHTIMYAVACDDVPILNKSIFTRHRIIKKEYDATDFRVGLWTDFDLGCVNDDAIGSIPELNAVVSYNIDPIDGLADGTCEFNLSSFGDNPGVQSIVMLNQAPSSINGYVGLSASVSPGMYIPVVPTETHNVLSGNWRDGTGMTFGGNGYNIASTDFTDFIFNGDINNPNEWSIISEDLPSFDFYPVMNTESPTFTIDEEIILDMAYVFSQDEALNNLETYDQAKLDIQTVQDIYDGTFSETCSFLSNLQNTSYQEFTISPNPVQEILNIQSSYESYKIFDNLGRLVQFNEASQKISVSNLAPGIYTILVFNEDQISKGRFIKQ